MKTRWVLSAPLLLFGCAAPGFYSPPEAVLDTWSTPSAQAARALIDKYGYPDEVRYNRLTWTGNGPWKRSVVRDVTPLYEPTNAESPVVEQTLDYAMTPSQAAELKAFNPALTVDAGRGELSSASDREEVNLLNLNLADEIVEGRKTVGEARRSYVKVLELEAAGKSSPYLEGLLFKVGPTRR